MSFKSHPSVNELDKLVMEGRAQLVATPTADTGTLPAVVSCGAGEVAIITKIVWSLLPGSDTSPGSGDQGSVHSCALYDENGDITGETMYFLSHQKVDTVNWSPSAPEASWLSAPPNSPLIWEPEMPLIIPPGHTLRAIQDGATSMAGGNPVCYGYMTDIGTARTLGFAVGTQDATYKAITDGLITTTELKNHTGFRGTLVYNTIASSVQTIVPGRAGYCVQVVDVVIRAQPMSGGSTTRTAKLLPGAGTTATILEILGATDTPFFVASNNNHSEMAEWMFTPKAYLEEGDGLYLYTPDDCRCSVTVTYRYVPMAEVPQGSFWGYKNITPAGANTNTVGTSSLYTDGSTDMTLFYAGKEAAGYSTTTATSPGTGYQHVVESYAFAVQKDPTIPGDRCYFALTEGTSAGNVGLSGSGLTTTNKLISPIWCAGGHNQLIALAIDGLNVPCLKDTGVIRLEMTGRGASTSTPAQNDLDIDEFHVFVSGRTIPAKYSEGHFRGAAS